MKLEDLIRNLDRRALGYTIGTAAAETDILEAERRLGVVLPSQVRMLYQHFDGLSVEHPALQILALSQLTFLASDLLHFATFDKRYPVCFDTAGLNSAHQWSIVDAQSRQRITFTVASFWSNKIWKWLDAGQNIWLPE